MTPKALAQVIRLSTILFALTVAPLSAQTLFRMDASRADPLAGWEYVALPGTGNPVSNYTLTRLPQANWNGTPAYEFFINNSEAQFYVGWQSVRTEPTPPANGETRYFRYRMWFDPASRFLGDSQLNNKMVILADGDHSRLMVHLNSAVGFEQEVGLPNQAASSGLYGMIQFSHNIGTGTPKRLIERDKWYHIQGSYTLASTAGASNGVLRLWINNNNYDTPSAQVGDLPIYTSTHNSVAFGRYWSNALNQGQTMRWRGADFEVGRSFEPSWFPGGGPSGPATPQGIRILQADFGGPVHLGLLALGCLGMGVRCRQLKKRPGVR